MSNCWPTWRRHLARLGQPSAPGSCRLASALAGDRTRWLRFNVVGVGGAIVQITTIGVLVHQAGMHYALATLAGVALALVHNFAWHRAWTWRDRPFTPGMAATAAAFARFAGSNGMVSLLGHTVVMGTLIEGLRVPPTWSAAVAITATSVVNYVLAGAFAFRGGRPETGPRGGSPVSAGS